MPTFESQKRTNKIIKEYLKDLREGLESQNVDIVAVIKNRNIKQKYGYGNKLFQVPLSASMAGIRVARPTGFGSSRNIDVHMEVPRMGDILYIEAIVE